MTAAGPPSAAWPRTLALVAVAISSIAGWEALKAALDHFGPSHRLRIDLKNSTGAGVAVVLIDPFAGRPSTIRELGSGEKTLWRPALAGDGMPFRNDPLYQLLVLDDRNEVVWREGYRFYDAHRVDAIDVSESKDGLKTNVTIGPKREWMKP